MKYNFFNYLFVGKGKRFSIVFILFTLIFYIGCIYYNPEAILVYILITIPLAVFFIGNYIEYRKEKKQMFTDLKNKYGYKD